MRCTPPCSRPVNEGEGPELPHDDLPNLIECTQCIGLPQKVDRPVVFNAVCESDSPGDWLAISQCCLDFFDAERQLIAKNNNPFQA